MTAALQRLEEGARQRMLAAFAPKSKGAVQAVIRVIVFSYFVNPCGK